MENIHIAIEGNIGVGKTSFCELFAKTFPHITVCPEPINQWKSFGPHKINLLESYYSDPKNFAYDFQHVALITKVDQLLPFKNSPKLVERSILAQSNVFIPLLVKNKNLTALQTEILLQSIKNYSLFMKPDIIIYLKINPIEALQRVKKRGRKEENNLSLTTLEEIHNAYENWLKNETTIPVITIEKDQEIDLNLIFQKIQEIFSSVRYQPKTEKYLNLWYIQMKYKKALRKIRELIRDNLNLNRNLTLSQDIIYQYSDLTNRANTIIQRYKLKYVAIKKELDYIQDNSYYKN